MKFNGFFVITAIFLVIIGYSNGEQRNLDFTFNEGCQELCKNKNIRVAHVSATGPNDTLHYLWDFTKNPTIFIAVTSPTSKLQINWKDYIQRIPNSVNFTEKPVYTFGVAVERILEFDDAKDCARIDEYNDRNIVDLKLKDFEWHHQNMNKSDNYVEFSAVATNYKDKLNNETRNGTIKFLVHGFNTTSHSNIMPCMLHTENATEIDIVIDDLETEKGFLHSRFALELLIVSENTPNSTLEVDTKRKIDDEFTPGIFEIMDLTAPMVNGRSAYLQWRPVSYIHTDRDVTNSTSTTFYPLKNATADNYFAQDNLLYMYYGENMFNTLVQRMNISLGAKKDGFYKETQYATWTFNVGYGTPPDEQFSYFVIMIIAIGVGLPSLLILASGIYICFRRRSTQTDGEFIQR